MNDNIMDKICEGCISYEQHIEDPENHGLCEGYKKKHIKCPCQNCLVKAMCDVACDKYKEEWRIFYGAEHH